MLHYVRTVSNITTIIIGVIRHVNHLCFSLSLVEETHREYVQLVKVDAPEVSHVYGTLSMLNMSRIHSSNLVRGRWLILFEGLYFVGQVCNGELKGSVLDNYLHQVVGRLNRYIWYATCGRLLRNFPSGHFHTGSGGTTSTSV